MAEEDASSGDSSSPLNKIKDHINPAWAFPCCGCVFIILLLLLSVAAFSATFSRTTGEETGTGGATSGIGSCATKSTITFSGKIYTIPSGSGKISHESHLVTIEDPVKNPSANLGRTSWGALRSNDGIAQHLQVTKFATNCSGCGISKEEWTPAEGGGKIGQGTVDRGTIPASVEPWIMNMRWSPMPPKGTKVIITSTKTGKSVVAAAGYEYGPSASTGHIAGGQFEVLNNLGVSHGGQVTIGFAEDQTLSFGPISCTTSLGSGTGGLGCQNVPIFRQCDPAWSNHSYGYGTTMCDSACGPTSAAMLLKFYGKNVNPVIIADKSLAAGFRIKGSGTSPALFSWIAKQYGLRGSGEFGWMQAKQYLQQGKPVIARMRGSSMFTSGSGHYIVLTCINSDGTIGINDPGPRKLTTATELQIRNYLKGASIIQP